ncbi:unnamed protein product [Cercopithifilaria johnstoni]|uniref:Chitinase n=1 Tax=Cercopithifilaria johnstoni TaxID=2874296 RepID=A0A8J2MC91_9BILA|nr:unnamed protein product [Cercopithifilaria johnstoni]
MSYAAIFAHLSKYVRGCYYTNWAQYRHGVGKFLPEDIPKGLCTHILYAFAKVNEEGKSLAYEWNDEDNEWLEGMYSRVMKLKMNDPALKILLSYGGYNFGSSTFTAIARSEEKRKYFIQSAIEFLRKHKFDGFDLDWEYPTDVAEEHAKLVEELKAAFVEEAKKSGKQQLLLTAAVSAGKATIDQSYNIQSLGKNFDLIFLMSYDLHGTWEKNVNLHGKLYPTGGKNSGTDVLNTEFAANYWASKGMPKQKIIIGIPTYSRGWTLDNPSDTAIGAGGSRPSSASATYPSGGAAAYWEICKYLKEGGKETIDKRSVGAYMVKGNQWHGYDNEETIKIKMRWLKEKGYGGAFIWTLDFDDFKGRSCGKGPYPLMNVINSELRDGFIVWVKNLLPFRNNLLYDRKMPLSSTLAIKRTQMTSGSNEIKMTIDSALKTKNIKIEKIGSDLETVSESSGMKCFESNGLFPHPNDCHLFIHCANNYPHVKQCPQRTFFNNNVKVCDHLVNAPVTCK